MYCVEKIIDGMPYYNAYCENKFVKITLLVTGILGIVLGATYFTGDLSVASIVGGSIALALFLISCGCYRPPRVVVPSAPEEEPEPPLAPPPPSPPKPIASIPEAVKAAVKGGRVARHQSVSEKRLGADPLGSAVLEAVRRGLAVDASYGEKGKGKEYHQGYRIHIRIRDSGEELDLILKPEIYATHPQTIFWMIWSGNAARVEEIFGPEGEERNKILTILLTVGSPDVEFLEIPDNTTLFL